MMRSFIRLCFSLMIVAGLGLGCRNDPAPQPRFRVIKAAQTSFNFEVTVLYQYDSLGRLRFVQEYPTVETDLSAVKPTAQTTVYYDKSIPSHIDYVYQQLTTPVSSDEGLQVGLRRTYNYDAQGRLSYVTESKVLSDLTTFKFVQAFQYEYGAGDLPVQLIVSGPPPLSERNIYTYTFENGNAVRVSLSVINSRSPTARVSESTVQFDEAPGVFTNFFALYPGITSFNKNNIINTNTTLYHDDRGLLTQRVKKGSYIDDVTEYTYETY